MSEYIDRAAALMKLMQDGCSAKNLQSILDIPGADVAPVVHGRWDDIPNKYVAIAGEYGSYHGNATTCSVCHEVNPSAFKTNYCPNCGARMIGG